MPTRAWTEEGDGAGSWLSHLWPRRFCRCLHVFIARADPDGRRRAHVICARSTAELAGVGQGWGPSGWREGERALLS